MDIVDFSLLMEGKHIFDTGSQPEHLQNCKGQFWKSCGYGQEPGWTLLIFYGPGQGSTFPTQVPNLNPNRTAKDHFGKVGGRVRSLTGHC